MAVIFMDGFDYYNLSTLSNDRSLWDEASGQGFSTFGGGRIGGNAYIPVTNQGVRKWLPAIGPTIGVGLAFATNGGGSSPCIAWALNDGGTTQIDLRFDLGQRKLYLTRNGTTILGPGGPVMLLGVWYFVETKVLIDGSTGTAEVRLNGATILSGTGLNTKATSNTTANRFQLSYTGGGGGLNYYDDVFVWDTSGSINTDWLGDCRVQTLVPNGAGTTTQFTPSTGSNWQNVDETSPNDDTDYNSDNNPGDIDTYAMADLSISTGTVMAVQSVLRHRKDDAGTRTIRRVIRSGGSNYEGSDIGVLDSYTYNREILEADPATSARWTVSGINAVEHGLKLQS